jgi:hypothetical protein
MVAARPRRLPTRAPDSVRRRLSATSSTTRRVWLPRRQRIGRHFMPLVLTVSTWAGCDLADVPAPVDVALVAPALPERASPTAALVVEASEPFGGDDAAVAAAVALVRGEPTPALVGAIGRTELPASARAQLVAVDVSRSEGGRRLVVTPRRALSPEARYTLVLAPRLVVGATVRRPIGRPLLYALTTHDLAEAAPVVTLVDPPDGAAGVPANLARVRVASSRAIGPDFALVDDNGDAIPLALARAEEGGDGTVAFTLRLLGALTAGRTVRLVAGPGAVAADGTTPFGEPPTLSIGAPREGEIPLNGLVVEPGDRCVVARFASPNAVEARLCAGGRCVDAPARTAHELALRLPEAFLDDGAPASVVVQAWDETRRPAARATVAVTPPSRLPLVVTEVLANPLGTPRLARQLVEIAHLGASPLVVEGLRLADDSGTSALPPLALAPGEVIVVVPRGAAALAPGPDAAVAEGARVVELAVGHVGGNGLRIGGEPLRLEEGDGRVVSRLPGLAAAPGQSVRRIARDACATADSVGLTPSGSATPGRLDW